MWQCILKSEVSTLLEHLDPFYVITYGILLLDSNYYTLHPLFMKKKQGTIFGLAVT